MCIGDFPDAGERFHNHLFRAWAHVKFKKSSAGIDGETIRGFEENLRDNLDDLSEELTILEIT